MLRFSCDLSQTVSSVRLIFWEDSASTCMCACMKRYFNGTSGSYYGQRSKYFWLKVFFLRFSCKSQTVSICSYFSGDLSLSVHINFFLSKKVYLPCIEAKADFTIFSTCLLSWRVQIGGSPNPRMERQVLMRHDMIKFSSILPCFILMGSRLDLWKSDCLYPLWRSAITTSNRSANRE